MLLVVEQGMRRLREQDLTAVARGADPRGAVDGEPVVLAVGRPQPRPVWMPIRTRRSTPSGQACGDERALRRESGLHGVLGATKRDEERVALRPDPLATRLLEG